MSIVWSYCPECEVETRHEVVEGEMGRCYPCGDYHEVEA